MLEQFSSRDDVEQIHGTFFRTMPVASSQTSGARSVIAEVRWTQVDVRDEVAVKAWVESLGKIDWLINCVGFLHDDKHGPEKSITQIDPEHFASSMAVNCLPTLLLGKYARPALKGSTCGVFATLSGRVGSIEDNQLGGWYSYRASKAALNMVLKCLSIEWERNAKRIRVASLHPGTTDTDLSQPFQKNVPEGKLFTAEKTAGLLIGQIEKLHEKESGRFIAYDGESIPW